MSEEGSCFVCGVALVGSAVPVEHIIPNALGGRLRSRAVLCGKHNGELSPLDAALANSLRALCNMIGFDRDRGTPPPTVVTFRSGEKYRREHDGHLYVIPTKPDVVDNGDGTASFRVTASSKADAIKTLQGLKRRRLPNLDVEHAMEGVEDTVNLVKEEMEFSLEGFGSADMLRGVIKIAVNYYLHTDGERTHVEDCIGELLSDKTPPVERVGGFYKRDAIRDRTDAITNLIFVSGRAGKLTAYIELLRAIRLVVVLNDSYEGPEVASIYAHDVLAKAVLPLSATDFVDGPWVPEEFDADAIGAALHDVARIGEENPVAL